MEVTHFITAGNAQRATLVLGKVESGPEGGAFGVYVDALLFDESASPLGKRLGWVAARANLAGKDELVEAIAREGAKQWAINSLGERIPGDGFWLTVKDPLAELRAKAVAALLNKTVDDQVWRVFDRFFPVNVERGQELLDEIRLLRTVEFEEMDIP